MTDFVTIVEQQFSAKHKYKITEDCWFSHKHMKAYSRAVACEWFD